MRLKRFLKILGSITLLIILSLSILYIIYNKPLPEGTKGPKADALAYKMLKAIHADYYANTRFLEWSFIGGAHTYKWDKTNGIVIVKWDDYTVKLNLNDKALSTVSKTKGVLSAKESRELTNTAWNYFNNDSFWLVAPFKVFDEGTERSIVTLENGEEALLIRYTQGGTTPGDSYLWKLDSNGFPESFRMWVKIIPLGGLKTSWDEWKEMENGVLLPTKHKIGPITFDMDSVRAY